MLRGGRQQRSCFIRLEVYPIQRSSWTRPKRPTCTVLSSEYSSYLQELGKKYVRVTIDHLDGLLPWLQKRDILKNVVPLKLTPN